MSLEFGTYGGEAGDGVICWDDWIGGRDNVSFYLFFFLPCSNAILSWRALLIPVCFFCLFFRANWSFLIMFTHLFRLFYLALPDVHLYDWNVPFSSRFRQLSEF